MNPSDKETIKRILTVNHAGEYGAIRIYRAQLQIAKRWHPSLAEFLEETLDHEIEHCRLFFEAMPARKARPCRLMFLWGYGGYLLGLGTALFGPQAIWVCTSAVEDTVHKHLEHQISFLEGKDQELADLINSIKAEELHHLDYANSKIEVEGIFAKILRGLISITTEVLIGLSTWGDSIRMAREVRNS